MADIPDDVEFIDDLKKLNQMVDGTKYDVRNAFFDKVSLFYGDITKIQVDAIVNSANAPMSGGGGVVDGCIRGAAGEVQLQAECEKHGHPVPSGGAVMTAACNLSTHVKNIIHCVGPICNNGVTREKRKNLVSCYHRTIKLAKENGLRTIAFPCISTEHNTYDNRDAARTVVELISRYFSKEKNVKKWDRVVLCLSTEVDKRWYKHYIMKVIHDPTYFNEENESEQVKARSFPLTDFTDANDKCHDLTLSIDGEKIHVSKQYLAIHSPVFKAMFYDNFYEKNRKKIELHEIDPMEFIELLDVIYPSNSEITELNWEYLLKLGDQFQMKVVINKVEKFLIVSDDLTIGQQLKISDEYRLAELLDHCLRSFKTFAGIQQLKDTEEYKSLSDKTKSALLDRVLDLCPN